jgi:signal transduction histidine kinase
VNTSASAASRSSNNRRLNLTSAMRIPRSLSVLETWGFGLTTPIGWLNVAVPIHAALGSQAIFVWLPAAIVAILLNLQVKQLGMHWPKMSGGTANYTTRLLKHYPELGRYAAIGYIVGWVSVPAVNAIVLTDLIEANLDKLGMACPEMLLRVAFTVLPFIVAFSGTRALGILQVFLVIPALLFGLAFCFQGISWLAFYPNSPGFFPPVEALPTMSLNFGDWAKWYFFGVYIFYGCETSAAFVADSKNPYGTLRCLSLINWIIPALFLGAPWVLMRLATVPELGSNAYLNLLTASHPFWGNSASFLVTLLIVSGCLLNAAASAALIPRILYQLALDGHLSPIFTFVSRRGVLEPALVFTFLISLFCLVFGNLDHLAVVTGTSWFVSFMVFHLALWRCRNKSEVRWPWLSLGFFFVEFVILIVGGLAWGWEKLLIGLLFPIAILAGDAVICRVSFPLFDPAWWMARQEVQLSRSKNQDFVLLQVVTLIISVCSAVAIAWNIRNQLDGNHNDAKTNLLAVFLLTSAFIEVAIACWTTLPQVAAIDEARKQAENFFTTALDAIVVVDANANIVKMNPAAEALFQINSKDLVGRCLHELMPSLAGTPKLWSSRSEQIFKTPENLRILESSVSQQCDRKNPEYMIILRDITERKLSEAALRQSEVSLREKATELTQALHQLKQTQAQLIQTEKMSCLGQLVAGVAHEINNPVNFIYGNLTHAHNYIQQLLDLINLYQQGYTKTDPEVQQLIEEIDFDFLIEDLPKLLSSMKVGAERIREIVLTLRNFSRLDEAEMKPVNIHEGIDSTLLILQNRLKNKPDQPGIEIVKQYGELPLVECYAGQLNQVFMNILTNGIDALHQYNNEQLLKGLIPKASTITIQTQVLSREWVCICIKDNGPGITGAVQEKLFDPFFTTKPVGEGTGLGLSISYQIIVEKHGGYLKCVSAPGQGAEFWIQIPVKQSTIKN